MVTTSSWVQDLAGSLLEAYGAAIPDDVLERAAILTFDSLACAAGAHGAPLVDAVRAVAEGSGPPEATLLFSGASASCLDAVLVNGTAVRYLDLNDAFIGAGPGGHPSDNIPVALAVGEASGATGREVLAAIALGYELYWRLRRSVYAVAPPTVVWDGVSVSGVVAAAVSGLLMGLDGRQFEHALALGLSKGYALRQVRRGSISMVKGCANALVARDGVLAARLAEQGVTGPLEVLEGSHGVLAAFGLDAQDGLLAELIRPPDWAIRNASIKPYPAIGTAQAAITGALTVARMEDVDPADIVEVRVHLPDTKATREHVNEEYRQRPNSRESADHSVAFLMAVALEDGELSLAQFEQERWLRASTRALMERVQVVPDASLVSVDASCYPAVLDIHLVGGDKRAVSVMKTPGSPEAPWGFEDVEAKFIGIQQLGWSRDEVAAVRDALRGLATAVDLTGLLDSLSPLGAAPPSGSE
jgi:2-methylcitrate dehydratase